MNHPAKSCFWRKSPTSSDEITADMRFLREMTFTSNHMHICRLSIKVDILFCLEAKCRLIKTLNRLKTGLPMCFLIQTSHDNDGDTLE